MSSILGLADLANNIASATKGLATAFGLISPDPAFPEYPDQGINKDFQREQWYKNPSQGLYSFSVDPVGQAEVSEFPAFIDNIKSLFDTFLGGANAFGEFKLPITPQEITQTEDFAVSIKPTQGGTVVNHSGNKYKTLVISGTTGVQPFRGILGVYKGTGLAVGKPDDLKYRSGYEVFQHFRQWMRSYHQMKAESGNQNMRMLFRNYKDWEFLYVEPLKFTMKRDAAEPLLYNYTIQFRVLGTHTIDKPLFDLVVSKLNAISDAVVNAFVLYKKNKSVTEYFTGVLSDFESSINNLKYALKAANKADLKLGEFSKADSNKLSYKETLQVLGTIGTAMGSAATNPAAAEQAGTTPTNADPGAKALELTSLAANPSQSNASAASAELNALLDSEPGLLTGIALNTLPAAIKNVIQNQQMTAALISKVQVAELQAQTQDISNKLSEGVGLSDTVYDALFGLTPTATNVQSEVTDDQFEMLYALSQIETAIDGILASDEMFDTNANIYSKASAQNGPAAAGLGIFSLPNPNGGVKEGPLPSGVTLEDLALSELGNASRWTEIAELNGLKAPYLVDRDQILKVNYLVDSANFTNPTQIRNLQIGQFYLIPSSPTPSGAWLGKGNQLGEYQGGDETVATSWRFIYPDDRSLVQVISTQQYYRFVETSWTEESVDDYDFDGVLSPGDPIKIPSASQPPIITPIQGPRDNLYTNTLTNGEKALAVDLRLNDDMDLDLTPSGDLNVVAGYQNAAQAIVLKLLYSKGSLKEFPAIGTNLTPGKKMPDIATLRTDLVSSLIQDTRIKNVTKINIVQENGALTLSFEVLFYDIQQAVPITIPI